MEHGRISITVKETDQAGQVMEKDPFQMIPSLSEDSPPHLVLSGTQGEEFLAGERSSERERTMAGLTAPRAARTGPSRAVGISKSGRRKRKKGKKKKKLPYKWDSLIEPCNCSAELPEEVLREATKTFPDDTGVRITNKLMDTPKKNVPPSPLSLPSPRNVHFKGDKDAQSVRSVRSSRSELSKRTLALISEVEASDEENEEPQSMPTEVKAEALFPPSPKRLPSHVAMAAKEAEKIPCGKTDNGCTQFGFEDGIEENNSSDAMNVMKIVACAEKTLNEPVVCKATDEKPLINESADKEKKEQSPPLESASSTNISEDPVKAGKAEANKSVTTFEETLGALQTIALTDDTPVSSNIGNVGNNGDTIDAKQHTLSLAGRETKALETDKQRMTVKTPLLHGDPEAIASLLKDLNGEGDTTSPSTLAVLGESPYAKEEVDRLCSVLEAKLERLENALTLKVATAESLVFDERPYVDEDPFDDYQIVRSAAEVLSDCPLEESVIMKPDGPSFLDHIRGLLFNLTREVKEGCAREVNRGCVPRKSASTRPGGPPIFSFSYSEEKDEKVEPPKRQGDEPPKRRGDILDFIADELGVAASSKSSSYGSDDSGSSDSFRDQGRGQGRRDRRIKNVVAKRRRHKRK